MDPISFSIELELGQLVLGIVGLVWTWYQHKDQKARYNQRERHHQENLDAYRNASDSASTGRQAPAAPAVPGL